MNSREKLSVQHCFLWQCRLAPPCAACAACAGAALLFLSTTGARRCVAAAAASSRRLGNGAALRPPRRSARPPPNRGPCLGLGYFGCSDVATSQAPLAFYYDMPYVEVLTLSTYLKVGLDSEANSVCETHGVAFSLPIRVV